MARYLVENHGFKKVNILDLFRKHIAEQNNFTKKDIDREGPKDNNPWKFIDGSEKKLDDEMSPFKFSEKDESPPNLKSNIRFKLNGITTEGGEAEDSNDEAIRETRL